MTFELKMLRIAHIDTERTWRGGEAQLMHLARGLATKGHRQWVVGQPGSPLLDRASKEGLETVSLGMPWEFSLPAIIRLVRFFRQNGIHVVHMHTSHAGTLGGIASKIAKVKVKVISRRVDFSIRNNLFRKLKYEWGANRIIAISEGIRDVLVKDGINPSRIVVIRSGIDLSRFDPALSPATFRKEIGVDLTTPLIGNIAHFADHKGHRYLIEAAREVMASLPGARFVLVGEGELKKSIEELVARLGLEKAVILTGFRTDIPAILAALDLFVLSSHLEGLCTSVMDAMAMGIAVVATRTGGVPEVVEDGVTGLLVPPRDPGALAGAIVRMIKDATLRQRMGRAGRERVVARFSARAMVDETETLYYQILKDEK
jgi:glycosyltransferase involved in cell wall biosynthesis